MAHEFPAPEQGVQPEHIEAHPTDTLVDLSHTFPEVVQEFIEYYLRPVQLQQVGAHGNMVELDPGVGVLDIVSGLVSGGMTHSVKVEEPTTYLDYLLQQTMATGNPTLPIPAMAVRGFANCGRNFFQLVRWLETATAGW